MLARAKVNLALHVTGRRADGLHLLDSLVVFPDIGDRLQAEPATTLSLTLDGPFGQELGVDADNLVIKAAMLMRQPGLGAALKLTKTLPLASGIGGGSADAAATLRLLSNLWGVEIPDTCLSLGADVPVCLKQVPARMQGIGEQITPVTNLPAFGIVLINRLHPIPTPGVFARLESRDHPPLRDIPTGFATSSDLFAFLRETRNDLEPPAFKIDPELPTLLEALRAQKTCALARMSGSGGTCFGLFETRQQAQTAAEKIHQNHPTWWISTGSVD